MKTPEFKIIYNPFTVDTELFIDGEALTEGRIYEETRNKRLQEWIDKILPILRDHELNSNQFKIFFEGTALDAEDVRDAITLFEHENEGVHVFTEFTEHRVSVEDKVGRLKKIFEAAQDGPFDEFRSPEMHRAFDKALAPEFEVNVIATMSSGKSTVINAMLGMELMPAKNEACTATIARIHDHDSYEHFEARRLNHDGKELGGWERVNRKILEEWNTDKDTSVIELKGNIPTISEREAVRMVLVDTPGPNNSRNLEHRKTTFQAIKGQQLSMVLYILNATQLSTDDDQSLLAMIKEAMEEGGRKAQDRFVFVANKIDTFDPEDGECVETTLEKIRIYLKDNGIANPLVIPASAELAKLIRRSNLEGRDKLTGKQQNSLSGFTELFYNMPEMNMLEHVKKHISAGVYKKLKDQLDAFRLEDNREKTVEILSGIPILESLLDNYLEKHALPSKIKDAHDSFRTIADKMSLDKKINDLLSKSDEEIVIAANKFSELASRNDLAEKAQKFRRDIEVLYVADSKEAEVIEKRFRVSFRDFINSCYDKYLKTDITPREAKVIIDTVERQACDKILELQVELQGSLDKDLFGRLETIKKGYESYVKDFLSTAFPEDKSMNIVRELHATALELPRTEDMVASAIYNEEVLIGSREVKDSKWYNPFSWGKKRTVYDYETVEKVNIGEPFQIIADSLYGALVKNMMAFKTLTKNNFIAAQKAVLASMDDMDRKIANIKSQLSEAGSNKESKEKEKAFFEEKKAWYDKFKNDLAQILSIKEI